MNVDRIREVGQLILAEPRRFDMFTWIAPSDSAPCGTTCCFAGEWVVLEFGMNLVKQGPDAVRRMLSECRGNGSISDACSKALGLPNRWLFFENCWPCRHARAARLMSVGTEEYARYFVETVLEDYIATNGWEDE